MSFVFETLSRMFVYYYVHIERPIEEIRRALLQLPGGIEGVAEVSLNDGRELRMRAGIGEVFAKTVKLAVGEPSSRDGGMVLPLSWTPTSASGLFPTMQGEILLEALGPDLSQITFRGTYRPPFRDIGSALDRSGLHRIAEATVKHFVDRLRTAILERDVRDIAVNRAKIS